MTGTRSFPVAARVVRRMARVMGGRAGSWTAAAALACIAAWAFWLRVRDPLLVNPVIPAEDPFTHIALAREHLATRSIAPLYPGSVVYPPGFDLLLALASAWTGVGFTTLAQTLPGLLGAIGVLGVAAVAWRAFGRSGAVLGSLVYALTPEVVFRGELLAPTALDLALMPLLLFGMAQVVAGRWHWMPAAAAAAVFETMAHPWALGLLAAGGALTIVLWLVRGTQLPRLAWPAVAAAVALLGTLLAVSLTGCGGWCGAGFDEVVRPPAGLSLDRWAWTLGLASWLPLAVVAVQRFRLRPRDATADDPPADRAAAPWRPAALAAVHALSLLLLVTVAWRQGLPRFVSPAAFGWPVLALAATGFVLCPFARHPLALAAAGIMWVTLPLVLFNPFHSAFWPHRTMAYLAVGCALAVAAAAPVVLGAAQDARGVMRPRVRRMLVPGALVAAALVIAGGGFAVAAETPTAAPWYRLFDACQAGVLDGVATQARADPQALYLLGSWQSKLVVSAFGSNASRLWFAQDLMVQPLQRATVVDAAARAGRHVHVVIDTYTLAARPRVNLTGLDGSTWTTIRHECPGGAITVVDLSEAPRFNPKSVGNAYWIEVDVLTPVGVTQVAWHANGTAWAPLERTTWGTWADATRVPQGNITFEAVLGNGVVVDSQPVPWRT